MLDVLAVFSAARERWMSAYVRALSEYRAKYDPSGPEVLLDLGPNGEPEVYRLYRVDLASGAVNPPNFTEVNLESFSPGPQLHAQHSSDLELLVKELHWNGVEFVVKGMGPESASLQEWCRRWLDVEETGQLDEHGLLGAIHSMTAPQVLEEGIGFSVDFGTAPVAAASELLTVLAASGARSVQISSSWAYQT